MSYCAAVNCLNKVGEAPGKTFHRFPDWNPTLFKVWLSKVKKCDKWSFIPSPVLCSDHFEESCFDKIGDIKHIRADAIPTLFSTDDKLKGKITEPSSVKPQITTVITSAKLFKSSVENGKDPLSEFHEKISEIYEQEKAERKKIILQMLLAFKRFSINQQKIKVVLNRSRTLRRKMMQTAMIMILLCQEQERIQR